LPDGAPSGYAAKRFFRCGYTGIPHIVYVEKLDLVVVMVVMVVMVV
jgi:hypothetical protein